MSLKKLIAANKKPSSDYWTPSLSEIVINAQLDNDSFYEDSNNQTRHRRSAIVDDEHRAHRPLKLSTTKTIYKNSKPHRLIEKRRRDRMNHILDVLLNLIPHKKPENGRRIEKTEIIDMAIKYIRLLSSNKESCEPLTFDKKSYSKVAAYLTGYSNGIQDIYEHIEKHTNDKQLLNNLLQYIDEKEIELKDLTVICDKKDSLKRQTSSLKKSSQVNIDKPNSNVDQFSISNTNKSQAENIFQSSINEEINSIKKSEVPIFVLHPSGTHYIPMCIDSSIVFNTFNNNKFNQTQILSINEQPHCHPVSIPVNFNPVLTLSDQYELDIQNINVVATR
ncbi:unnamed protein product [Rotaria sp. Silwood2]|nr:unnamed protein product [Rotaria sp. Silwood2]CAF4394204.1 unnamed protein product [Rotaria sp. Silwood2]